MKISQLIPTVLIVSMSILPACVVPTVSSPGRSQVAALGPDGVVAEEAASSLPARIAAGLTWLWSSYSALKAKGLDVSGLREAISEMQDVVQNGDLGAALSLYGKARAIITGLVG